MVTIRITGGAVGIAERRQRDTISPGNKISFVVENAGGGFAALSLTPQQVASLGLRDGDRVSYQTDGSGYVVASSVRVIE